MAHSEGRSPRQGVRGAPSGLGGPRARSAGVSRPGAASGPARSAAAAPRSRCLGSLLSATWVLPSHRLCARGQRGSASRPECKWGLLEGEAPATGWWSPTLGHVSLRPDKPPTVGPKEGSAPEHPPPPQLAGPVNTAAWIRPSACGLATEPRAGITSGSISCL